MYAFISGRIADASNGRVVLENNGIGYEMLVSNATFARACETGKNIQLYTYLRVSDDGVALYGFITPEEKGMFLKLITVSGVGPKVALALLSGISLKDLGLALVTGDTKMLTGIKGIGKKTAERIILELRGSADVAAQGILDGTEKLTADSSTNDALAALVALGLSRGESVKAVERALALGASETEKIIALALKSLG